MIILLFMFGLLSYVNMHPFIVPCDQKCIVYQQILNSISLYKFCTCIIISTLVLMRYLNVYVGIMQPVIEPQNSVLPHMSS